MRRRSESAGPPRTPLVWLAVLVVFVIAWFVAGIPREVLGVGLHTAGGRLGWWIGDPNSDDGEEIFATVLGVMGIGVVGTVALLLSGAAVAFERRAWPVLPLADRVRRVPVIGGGSALTRPQ